MDSTTVRPNASTSLSYLHKSTLGVADVTVELTVADTVHLRGDPADVAIQVVLLNKVKHLLELSLLLLVLRWVAMVTTDNHKVNQLLQARVATIQLNQTSQVLDTVKTSHGEDDWLVPVLQHKLVLVVVNFAVEQLLNLWVEGGEPLTRLRVREVDGHVRTRRDNVKLRVKNINTVDNTVQTRHGECHVRLILTNKILLSGNLLEGTGDDEVSVVHRNQVSCELA
ncbi:Os03g0401333 [Oryza sativa Japonica Group]|uniref:Os03g0401333 protein n=1 Tax=Oryza sativa subsp. japonica TaxID=39947 RepID=A0A0P0VZA1_ORYSJ|nr:hypothetical protein EE612_017944 [Oryza sativa]BAS84607.1 Os03g0401333 [Oryza sativa Japonica Group]